MTNSEDDPEEEDESEGENVAEVKSESPPDSTTEPSGDQEADHADEPPEKIPLSELRDEVAEGDDVDVSDEADRSDVRPEAGDAEIDPDTGDESDDKIPLSDLRSDVVGDTDAAEEAEMLFHEERVEEVESEAVWAELLMDSGETEGLFDPTAIEAGSDRTYQIVPTSLCHRCEFFGDPPTLHCTHEGTTIHETVDMDHYRVSDCPMVEDDKDARVEKDQPLE